MRGNGPSPVALPARPAKISRHHFPGLVEKHVVRISLILTEEIRPVGMALQYCAQRVGPMANLVAFFNQKAHGPHSGAFHKHMLGNERLSGLRGNPEKFLEGVKVRLVKLIGLGQINASGCVQKLERTQGHSIGVPHETILRRALAAVFDLQKLLQIPAEGAREVGYRAFLETLTIDTPQQCVLVNDFDATPQSGLHDFSILGGHGNHNA